MLEVQLGFFSLSVPLHRLSLVAQVNSFDGKYGIESLNDLPCSLLGLIKGQLDMLVMYA